MKRTILITLALILLASGCTKQYKLDLSNCIQPSQLEISAITPLIPDDFEIQNMRRVDTNPAFVFVSLVSKTNEHSIDFMVFEIIDGEISKYYQMGSTDGKSISLGPFDEQDNWGSTLWDDDQIICPVYFFTGGNSWVSSFVKFFSIKNGELSEIEIELAPWTVAKDTIEKDGEILVEVMDARFEIMSGLSHTVTPSRTYLYGMKNEKLVDVTLQYSNYTRQQIHDTMLKYRELNSEDGGEYMIGYGLQAYLYAEAGDMIEDYYNEILDMLDPSAYVYQGEQSTSAEIRNLVIQAHDQGVPVASLRGYSDSFEDDFRWDKIIWKVEEFSK